MLVALLYEIRPHKLFEKYTQGAFDFEILLLAENPLTSIYIDHLFLNMHYWCTDYASTFSIYAVSVKMDGIDRNVISPSLFSIQPGMI